ncbi:MULTISPECIES: hypothetical protein [Staphylococcus]|uniref:hypothetical protein n=1 Tax=Staphylococcus TaxID=1279 RepID=UPI00076B50F8|nr:MULTISPECIES: hypothetical protein [Staphylococcus]AMG64151.1 hypothetical protein AL501_07805 [Staphylococcus lugdunensis]ARB76779.1 hypothetical protein A6J61_00015 [Staphylococcus lugdunensis]ARJ12978.1 hypothetical protein B7468_01215 [Staphylococcus lugdunensis]ARJ17820.1 hypothetical protein B7467_02020 [Staphylococcus lugdunensis]MBM7133994.1 hypothetical protein [Staphylococcus lugdunensis]
MNSVLLPTHSKKVVEKYNQKFTGVTANGRKASKVQFVVKGNLTYDKLVKAYGNNLKKVKDDTNRKDISLFVYKSTKKGLGVTCFVKHGKVVEVDMSDARFTTSK